MKRKNRATCRWVDKLLLASRSKKMALRLELYTSAWLYEEEDIVNTSSECA